MRSGFDPWVRKIPREGRGYPLQYSFLENLVDRGAWCAAVHGVTESRTLTEQLSTHTHLGVPGLSCSMWDLFCCGMQTLHCSLWGLVPPSGIKPSLPALGAQSPSHWTTREVPVFIHSIHAQNHNIFIFVYLDCDFLRQLFATFISSGISNYFSCCSVIFFYLLNKIIQLLMPMTCYRTFPWFFKVFPKLCPSFLMCFITF